MKEYNYFNYLSNWLNIWLMLFFLKLCPYNPTFAYIICALICFIVVMIRTFTNYVNNIIEEDKYTQFVIILIISKFIPLYLLYICDYFKYNYIDIYISFIVFFSYLLYLYINKLDIYKVYVIQKDYMGPDYILLI